MRGYPLIVKREIKGCVNFSLVDRKRESTDRFLVEENLKKVAGAAGLEPVTSAVTGQRSNQLSYAPAKGRKH